MFERFTDRSRRAIVLAQEAARELGHDYIGTEHLLLGLVREGDGIAASVLTDAGVSDETLVTAIVGRFPAPPGARAAGHLPFTPRAKKALELSLREALQLGHAYIGTEHLLLGLLSSGEESFAELLGDLAVSAGPLRRSLQEVLGDTPAEPERGSRGGAEGQSDRYGGGAFGPGRQQPARMLDQYGHNLTAAAAAGKVDPVIGRDREIERLMQVLCRRTKNNPVLIGEPGVGKTAVVEGLARRIAADEVPAMLAGVQLYSLDLGSMVAGTRYRGDFEERLKKLLAEVTGRDDVVLFLDELHMLVGAGAAEGAIDAASMLKPLLARGGLRVVGATTTDEYRKHIEKDAALERRFQPVPVAPPSVADTVRILEGLRPAYEEFHRVTITDDALTKAAELSDRYISDRFLPDKAIDVLDEAGARLRTVAHGDDRRTKLEAELARIVDDKVAAIASERFEEAVALRVRERELTEALEAVVVSADLAVALPGDSATGLPAGPSVSAPTRSSGVVDGELIAEVVSAWTGVPLAALDEGESHRLLELEARLHDRVIGQDLAVSAVARAIRRSRSGLGDPKRPSGSFVFLGPSGVGKTELARTLAELLFDDERALIQLDMSEYMESHTVSRLIGSPPGYVGHDEGGLLTEAVRRRPYAVVLFDEVEKAHPDVFNVLLQLLEEGQLTDAQGRKVNFRNTLVVLTSNLGTAGITAPRVGFALGSEGSVYDTLRDRAQEALRGHFRPELLNRIDETVVFAPLSLDEVEQIVELLLVRIHTQLAERQVALSLSPEARRWLASQGFDPQLGARPLRRALQRHLEDPLAELLLSGGLGAGSVVAVDVPVSAGDVADTGLVFSVVEGVAGVDELAGELSGQAS
jgi:ATP-dependent Clp protease ATP-binding subunit ClpC